MQRCHQLSWGLCALLLLGCRSNSPYGNGGYGYNSYGGAYPAGPSGPYSSPAPGTVLGPSTAPGMPPTGMPTTSIPPSSYQPMNPGDPSRITEAPPYNPQQPSSPPPNSQPLRDPKRVPDPIEAGSGGNPAHLGNPLDDDADEIKRPTGSTRRNGPNMDALTDDSDDALSAFGDENFTEPVRHASSTSHTETQLTRSGPNPYAYDRRGYSWLRGVVDFDESDRSWRITYNATPVEGDAYGGTLTLMHDEMLDTLLVNDVVYLEGVIDPSLRDRFAKPKYKVGRVMRLVPKPANVAGPAE